MSTLLFAHGAGAGHGHPWMQAWTHRLEAAGHRVIPLSYPYMLAGKRLPDRLPVLLEAHREALVRAREEHGEIVLVGKSMGGRVGCHLALEEPVEALVCLGYPLIGGGKVPKVRDEVLRALGRPVLFVQGERDPKCPLAHLDEVRQAMEAPSQLHVVPDGDHSLQSRKRPLAAAGRTQDDLDQDAMRAIDAFLAGRS